MLGLSKWRTQIDVWLEIMEERKPGFCEDKGFLLPEKPENPAMKWGLAFEEAIKNLASIEYFKRNQVIFPEGTEHLIIDSEKESRFNEFITCHQDGEYIAGPLHEGKTANIYSFGDEWGEPGTDRIPRDYQVQCQHQMIATEKEDLILSVLLFPKRPAEWEAAEVEPYQKRADDWAVILADMGFFHQYFIKAHGPLQELMIKYYKRFWREYVIGETAPPITDYEDIRKLVPAPKGTIVATEQIESWSAEYTGIRDEQKRGENRKKELKKLILEFMTQQAEAPVDEDSVEKWILKNRKGRKLHQYDGKTFK